MASDLGVGDSELATLTVEPADGSTQVTLTVTPPTGTAFPVAMTGGDLVPIPATSPVEFSQVWTSDTPIEYTLAGRWVLHFEVTGTGEGAEDLEVYVQPSATAGGPTWLPGRSRVANYVPHRTLVRSMTSTGESEDQYAWTWDSTTTPTGIQVDRLIADGADWVTALVTPLNTASEPLASLLAALWAAVAVERGWPHDDQSLQRANDMERRIAGMLTALIKSNSEANYGTDDGFDIVQGQWSFPPADTRYDSSCYW